MKARCYNCHHVFTVEGNGPQICPNCGTSLTLNLPSPDGERGAAPNGFQPEEDPVEPTPWEKRGELGFFKALIDTVILSVKSSDSFFGRMPRDNSNGAISYYWIICGFSSVMTTLWSRITSGLLPMTPRNEEQLQQVQKLVDMAQESGSEPLMALASVFQGMVPGATGGSAVLGMACSTVAIVVLIPVCMLAHALFVHFFCMICGAARNGFKSTLRAVGYSCAPMLAGVIPFCSAFGGLATMILTVIGLSKVHGVTKTRAAVAYLMPIFICCCLGALAAVIGGASMIHALMSR